LNRCRIGIVSLARSFSVLSHIALLAGVEQQIFNPRGTGWKAIVVRTYLVCNKIYGLFGA